MCVACVFSLGCFIYRNLKEVQAVGCLVLSQNTLHSRHLIVLPPKWLVVPGCSQSIIGDVDGALITVALIKQPQGAALGGLHNYMLSGIFEDVIGW